jgi:acyl dehydratase
MTAVASTRRFETVSVGDAIPPLEFDVTPSTVVLGATAAREWRAMHHDPRFAVEHSGTRDIFVSTATFTAFFERAVTDWTGPAGRLGRLSVSMAAPVFPGERIVITGEVTSAMVDASGCGWVELAIHLTVGDEIRANGTARVALPTSPDDNPWARRSDRWRP